MAANSPDFVQLDDELAGTNQGPPSQTVKLSLQSVREVELIPKCNRPCSEHQTQFYWQTTPDVKWKSWVLAVETSSQLNHHVRIHCFRPMQTVSSPVAILLVLETDYLRLF